MVSYGQAVEQKHLIISLGGGGGYSTLISTIDSLHGKALRSSAIRFAFGYALSEKWSLGGHYDRIGTVVHPGQIDRIRYTTYMIEGTYRPFNKGSDAIETSLGVGVNIAVVRPEEALIPFRSMSPVLNIGARYLHLINGTIGLFISIDHAQGFESALKKPDGSVTGDPARISWHAQRLNGGMLVRF